MVITQKLFAPGQRVEIRDAEWLNQRVDYSTDGRYVLTCDGPSELIARNGSKRILVLTVKSMLTQFQQEFWERFIIPFLRLESAGQQHIRNHTPSYHNPGHYFDRSLISIDTNKQDIEYLNHLEQSCLCIIIIDKVRHVAESDCQFQKSRLAVGWEDFKEMTASVLSKKFMDDKFPEVPAKRRLEYQTHFFEPDRGVD